MQAGDFVVPRAAVLDREHRRMAHRAVGDAEAVEIGEELVQAWQAWRGTRNRGSVRKLPTIIQGVVPPSPFARKRGFQGGGTPLEQPGVDQVSNW